MEKRRMNDTIRKGITLGPPGSDQRIADLRVFYSRDHKLSAFDPTVTMSYGTEQLTGTLSSVTYVYNHMRKPVSLEG